MEGILWICAGLIGFLFYRTQGQKKQLSILQSQLYKLQQQFLQLKQSAQSHEAASQAVSHTASALDTEAAPEPVDILANVDEWRAEPQQQPLIPATSNSATVSSAKPTGIEQALLYVTNLAKNYFSQGNQIVRIGIIVLFFGMSFLAKYSIENSLISIEVRMVGILMAALLMLGIGWHLRLKNPAYGLIMQGGGIAIGYIAIFASFKLYQLIPSGQTFPLLIVFSIAAMSLAILQNSRALAITAIIGGFAAPILASTGQGSHIGLFSYYLVLNCAIFFVAWFKSWRLLNVIGFLFTFVIASFWGVTQYRSAQFSSTEPFLIAFFLIYVAISILFSIKQKPNLKGYVDGTLVFGVPMVGFGLQSALVHHIEYGLAYSAAALAGFYLLIAYGLRKKFNSSLHLMSQAMLALGIIFATLTIPFALDGCWSASSWAIEGAGFVWIALRQQREILKYVGLALQLLGGILFLIDYPYRLGSWAFMNAEFIGVTIISVSALFTAYILNKVAEGKVVIAANDEMTRETLSGFKQALLSAKILIDSIASVALIIWGIVWWYIGAWLQVDDYISRQYELVAYVVFITFSSALWLIVSLRLRWVQVNFYPWLLLLPLCLYFWPTALMSNFSANYGLIIWPLALALLYGGFYKAEKDNYALFKPVLLHCIGYLLIVSIISYELAWYVDSLKLATAWCAVVVMIVLIVALDLINKTRSWPFEQHTKAYHHIAAPIIVISMLLWSIGINFSAVLQPSPMPYLPLLNPIDLFQLLALFVVVQWYRLQGKALCDRLFKDDQSKVAIGILSGFGFIWFNVLLLKTVHVITGVCYDPESLFDSAVVQTSLSITWTIIGLVVMVLASKQSLRSLWIGGASLTAVVVAKLFLLDLSGQGTIERIISFIVVGALLLVVGYFSPVPPSEASMDKASAAASSANANDD